MTVTALTTAERIAVAICWLYRWRGEQPPTTVIREVADRHGVSCDWCDFPMDELIRLCDLGETADLRTTGRSPHDYDAFRRYPTESSDDRRLAAQALRGTP